LLHGRQLAQRLLKLFADLCNWAEQTGGLDNRVGSRQASRLGALKQTKARRKGGEPNTVI
jgi:hypothetical protein